MLAPPLANEIEGSADVPKRQKDRVELPTSPGEKRVSSKPDRRHDHDEQQREHDFEREQHGGDYGAKRMTGEVAAVTKLAVKATLLTGVANVCVCEPPFDQLL